MTDLTDDDLRELAYSAHEEAMAFGLSHETFLRYFKTIRQRAAAPVPPQQGAEPSFDEWAKKNDMGMPGSFIYEVARRGWFARAALPVTRSAPAADGVQASRHCHECMVNVTGPCQYKGCPVGVAPTEGGQKK